MRFTAIADTDKFSSQQTLKNKSLALTKISITFLELPLSSFCLVSFFHVFVLPTLYVHFPRSLETSWFTSPFYFHTLLDVCLFRNMFILYGEGLLSPIPTPKLKDHPLSFVGGCLFNIVAATLHS
jgi:hypothetical protein